MSQVSQTVLAHMAFANNEMLASKRAALRCLLGLALAFHHATHVDQAEQTFLVALGRMHDLRGSSKSEKSRAIRQVKVVGGRMLAIFGKEIATAYPTIPDRVDAMVARLEADNLASVSALFDFAEGRAKPEPKAKPAKAAPLDLDAMFANADMSLPEPEPAPVAAPLALVELTSRDVATAQELIERIEDADALVALMAQIQRRLDAMTSAAAAA